MYQQTPAIHNFSIFRASSHVEPETDSTFSSISRLIFSRPSCGGWKGNRIQMGYENYSMQPIEQPIHWSIVNQQ